MVVKFRNFVLAGLAVSLVKGNTFNPRSCQPAIDNGQFRDLVFKSDNLGGGIKAICWPPSLFTIGFDANRKFVSDPGNRPYFKFYFLLQKFHSWNVKMGLSSAEEFLPATPPDVLIQGEL